MDGVDVLDVSFLDGMGLKTSHMYRMKLLQLFATHLKKSGDQFMLFMIVEQIKNKGRIMAWFNNPANRAAHGTKSWWTPVKDFVSAHTLQYVQEVERVPANSAKFPLVNLPGCYPSMASLAFKVRLHRSGKMRTMTPEVMLETFMDNRWAAQMNIQEGLLDDAKMKDQAFWSKIVKKSKNPYADAYEKGWNEDYFTTKSKDNYHFYNLVGGKIVEDTGVMDRAGIVEWMQLVPT